MTRQTICTNCTRLFKRGIIRHTKVKIGVITTDRELICVWRGQPMNNINVAHCNAFKKRKEPNQSYSKQDYIDGLIPSNRNLLPSNVEGN